MWHSPRIGRDHLTGAVGGRHGTDIGFLTYQLPLIQKRHRGFKGT